MSQADFVAMLEMELAAAGVAYERRHLQDFDASAWVLIQDEPDSLRWAREFVGVAVPQLMAMAEIA